MASAPSSSKRQVARLLNAGQDNFLTEARHLCRLSSADWITVDDTRRHKVTNGFSTV
jgi:hypothetical protein